MIVLWRKHAWAFSAVLLVAVAAQARPLLPNSSAQREPDLWSVIDERPAEVLPGRVPGAGAHRARTVRTNADRLHVQSRRGDRLVLDLEAGVSLVAELDLITDDELNGYVWNGRVIDEPFSMVTLVAEPDGIAGTVLYSGGAYHIRLVGDGLSVVRRTPLHKGGANEMIPMSQGAESNPQLGAASTAREVAQIDVLGLYNKKALTQIGGKRALKADFKTAIANMNTALRNSKMAARVRLVATKKMPYSKSGSDSSFIDDALVDLQAIGDGQMDKAHKLRARFGADIVSLAIEINDVACAQAFVTGSGSGVTASDAIWAFGVVSVDCYAGFGGQWFSRGAGANMGFKVAPFTAREARLSGAYRYSFGHRVPGILRTIMANSCTSDGLAACQQVPYYSNPKVKVGGTATGVKANKKDPADNARSLKNDAATIAGWMPCQKKC